MTTSTRPPTASAHAVAEQIFAVLAKKDLDALADLQHEDVTDEFIALELVAIGIAPVRSFFEELFAAFPDFTLTVGEITSSGNAAVVQWEATGTFTGAPFQGVAATGRSVAIRGVDCMVIEDGRLRRNTIYYDGAAFLRDIGLLPGSGSRPERLMKSAFNAGTRAN